MAVQAVRREKPGSGPRNVLGDRLHHQARDGPIEARLVYPRISGLHQRGGAGYHTKAIDAGLRQTGHGRPVLADNS